MTKKRLAGLAAVALAVTLGSHLGCSGDDDDDTDGGGGAGIGGQAGGGGEAGSDAGAGTDAGGSTAGGVAGDAAGGSDAGNGGIQGEAGSEGEAGAEGKAGAGGAGGAADEFEELDLSVCDPEDGSFSTDIDNEFFPLAVGTELVLEGEEEDDEGEVVTVRVEITVLDEMEEVAGVMTRVVEEREFEDDELIEVSRNFFVQTDDGTVCYFGEDVDDYEDGMVVSNEGAWRAGEDDNAPGIIMPGEPMAGTQFFQERAPGIAEDKSAITALNRSISVPAGDFDDALLALDWNPLEGDTIDDGEEKYYVPGIGLVVDDVVELIEYEIP